MRHAHRTGTSFAGLIAAVVAGALSPAACGGSTAGLDGNAVGSDGGAEGSRADGPVSDAPVGADARRDGELRPGFVSFGCSNNGGSFPLAALTTTPSFDYAELRIEDGYQRTQPDAVIDKIGTLCAHATDVAKCKQAFTALEHPVMLSCGVPYPCSAEYLATTRGDEVRAYVAGKDDLAKMAAPLDSVEEAAFVVGWMRPLTCANGSYREIGDGWDLAYTYQTDHCTAGGNVDHRHDVLVHVSKSGDVTLLEDVDTPLPPPTNTACAAARRASGVRYEVPDTIADVGDWLATAAHLEAASVASFARLARELAAHGAPHDLIARAAKAARDERRHARMLRILARKAGKRVARAPRIDARVRLLQAIALENAVEGRARETWGAVVVAHQAEAAPRADLRAAFAIIAQDEAEHAALACDVAAWIDARLDPAACARVEAARQRSLAHLERECTDANDANDEPFALPDRVRESLGLPTREVAARLMRGARAALFEAA